MGDENKVRDAADAVKGVLEAVPVYQDVAQPAAKEIGTALQTVAKAIHIALAPVSVLVWGYERIRDYLNETLTEKLKRVPPDRIVTPSPTVAGPIVEALRFAAHELPLRELYANLLATSMDADTAQEAHPAFVEVIRQLAPDEARLLAYLHLLNIKYTPLLSGQIVVETGFVNHAYAFRRLSVFPEHTPFHFSDLIPTYIDNLIRLGLLEAIKASDIKDANVPSHYDVENVAKDMAVTSTLEFFESQGWEKPKHLSRIRVNTDENDVVREYLRFTSLGRQFSKACITEDSLNY